MYRDTLLVDSGRLGTDADTVEAVIRAMGMMQYAALGVGLTDYRVGAPFFAAAGKYNVDVVSASGLALAEHARVRPLVWAQVGRRRIAITSTFALGRDPAHAPERELKALGEVLQPVRPNADLVIVLSQLGLTDDQRIGTAPETAGLVDIVIGNHMAQNLTAPIRSGSTLIVPTSVEGKGIGVIEVSFGPRGRPRPRVRMETVSVELPSDRTVWEAIKDAVTRQEHRRAEEALRQIAPAPYAGADACVKCHEPQVRNWQQSRHAKALDTLREGKRLTPSCLPCHSDQYRRQQLLSPESAGVEGVECVSCHGPGQSHAQGLIPGDVVRRAGKETCLACHSPQEDQDFDYTRDIKIVSH